MNCGMIAFLWIELLNLKKRLGFSGMMDGKERRVGVDFGSVNVA
jgi:hypothetical protein